MFSFQSCSSVPVKGGRLLAGEAWGGGVGGLVEVDGRIVWGGDDGAYILDENCKQWERLADSSETKATLAVCGGCLVYVGGLTNGLCSNKVMVWKEGKWTFMTEMLEGCWRSSVVTCSAGEGSLVVMGGIDNEGRTSVVQVFDVKTKIWHKGQPLPLACWALSAVVHENQVFVMGGHAMDHAVWSANIAELVSHETLCSIHVHVLITTHNLPVDLTKRVTCAHAYINDTIFMSTYMPDKRTYLYTLHTCTYTLCCTKDRLDSCFNYVNRLNPHMAQCSYTRTM